MLESATEYAITALDPDGRFLTWNEGARRLYGYTAEEMVGKRDLAGSIAAGNSRDRPEDRRASCGRPPSRAKSKACSSTCRRGGRRVPVAATISRREDADGLSIGYVLVARDITAQQRAEAQRLQLIEEQAARSEAEAARDRLQQVIDVLPEGIILVDTNGQSS